MLVTVIPCKRIKGNVNLGKSISFYKELIVQQKKLTKKQRQAKQLTCNHSEVMITPRTFKNQSYHLEKRCIACNKHLGYQSQKNYNNLYETELDTQYKRLMERL